MTIERKFNMELNDEKRLTLLYALGFMYREVCEAPGDVKTPVVNLIHELSALQGRDVAVPTNGGTEAAKAILQPPATATAQAVTEKFQRDRKGNAQTSPPEGSALKTVRILQADEDTTRTGAPVLKVIFAGGKANCFEPQLWDWIKERAAKQESLGLWIAKSGVYQNIVGVRYA